LVSFPNFQIIKTASGITSFAAKEFFVSEVFRNSLRPLLILRVVVRILPLPFRTPRKESRLDQLTMLIQAGKRFHRRLDAPFRDFPRFVLLAVSFFLAGSTRVFSSCGFIWRS
jgi:hypothetical protein